MCRRTAIVALLVQAVLRAVPQAGTPDAAPQPLVLKSSSHAVQLDVFVSDPSGRPVRGLQKDDFVVTDNGRRRDIRIFAGEIDADQTAPSTATTTSATTTSATTEPPPGVYSNRIGMRDSRIVTAIVIDVVPRPEGLQKDAGIFASKPRMTPEFRMNLVRGQAMSAIDQMAPGQIMAIYAACPELRIVQDYTSDPDRLTVGLRAFVPPMLAALRDVAGRMSGASGRKSVVWISQAYGVDLNLRRISDATESTIAAFDDAKVPLYTVDARFNLSCEPPVYFPGEQTSMVNLTCSQPPDVSDEWMRTLAQATGGRAFSGGKVSGMEWRGPPPGPMGGSVGGGRFQIERDRGVITDALRFAEDDSRYAYEMGFYVPESELDGKVHKQVTVPAKPKVGLSYRSGYTASGSATAPPVAKD